MSILPPSWEMSTSGCPGRLSPAPRQGSAACSAAVASLKYPLVLKYLVYIHCFPPPQHPAIPSWYLGRGQGQKPTQRLEVPK